MSNNISYNVLLKNKIAPPPPTSSLTANKRFRYRSKHHADLPHVVKFSGGRSSGMLLFALLQNGILKQERGDVIVFNNTSAEHPETYRFIKRCMESVSVSNNPVPFFHIEYQTYEDCPQGYWTRIPTYRLVNSEPWSEENENGYHWKGEVFEELLSYSGFVPNQFQRICTLNLKIEVTRNFLRDWFASQPTIARQGHFGDSSRISHNGAWRLHRKNRGQVPEKIFHEKRKFVLSRPHFRKEQRYSDYCEYWKEFDNKCLKDKTPGNRADFGKGGVEYVSLIGLRQDEQIRVQRVLARSESGKGLEGEHVYLPLNELEIKSEDVDKFWKEQNWDLNLDADDNLSNCVFCFLKGEKNLVKIRNAMAKNGPHIDGFGSLDDTPCDIRWWTQLEGKYSRNLSAERRSIRSNKARIGFFGNEKSSYRSLQAVDGTEVTGGTPDCSPTCHGCTD